MRGLFLQLFVCSTGVHACPLIWVVHPFSCQGRSRKLITSTNTTKFGNTHKQTLQIWTHMKYKCSLSNSEYCNKIIFGKVRRPLVHHFIQNKYKIYKKSEKNQNAKYNIQTKYKGIDWENLWESKKTIGAPLRPVRRSEHISLTQTHSAVDAPYLRSGQVWLSKPSSVSTVPSQTH